MTCLHCGTEDCEALFQQCLTLDFSDSDFGVVHHLVVGTHMVQHNRYTNEAQTEMIHFLSDLLTRVPNAQDKANVRSTYDGATRVMRREPAPPLMSAWSTTIADVDVSSGEAYQRTVRTWAQGVLETLKNGERDD